MSTKDIARWGDTEARVESLLISRYFYTTASVNVYIAGNCILRTGGVMRLSGKNATEFVHNGAIHRALLEWASGTSSVSYTLKIDGSEILKGRVFPRNILMGLTPVLLFAAIVTVLHLLAII